MQKLNKIAFGTTSDCDITKDIEDFSFSNSSDAGKIKLLIGTEQKGLIVSINRILSELQIESEEDIISLKNLISKASIIQFGTSDDAIYDAIKNKQELNNAFRSLVFRTTTDNLIGGFYEHDSLYLGASGLNAINKTDSEYLFDFYYSSSHL